ncbi:hypothetical protein GYA25_00900 [Candidatus Woesearchaeota archaeon]|jgi:hypothetical protein|nr:hypothetical protein [Candidatus Woesearchaeota archaeon]
MNNTIQILLQELGMPLWLFIIIFIWVYFWKLYALWTAAQKKSLPWFIFLAIFNTMGILEILYIYVFSKSNLFSSKKVDSKKNSRKKKR